MAKPTETFETQYFHSSDTEQPLKLRCGEEMAEFTLAYESYGKINTAKDNVILLVHRIIPSQASLDLVAG